MQLSDITPGKTYRLKNDIVLPGNDVLARKGQQARAINCTGHGDYVVLVETPYDKFFVSPDELESE